MNTYTPTNWINGETAINQTNLNHIEQGISNNNSAILDLANGMKFKGTISSLPIENLEIGNVYQAAERIVVNNKLCDVGDLIVYVSTNTWHVIPSGDENDGTLQLSGKVRVGANYSAQDIVLISIYLNSTEVYMHRYRVPPNMTTPAQDITLPMIPLTVSASDKITLEVVNGTGARGIIIDDECKLYAMYIAPTLS